MPPVKVQDLSIYNQSSNEQSPAATTGEMLNIGNSTMMLVSEVKEKYNKILNTYKDFKIYAKSTEGKVKFSVMSVGLVAGGIMALRSKSTRTWYKRMIPAGSFLCACSLCYPYKAYEVSKSVTIASYHATLSVVQFSKASFQKAGAAYEKYRQIQKKDSDKTNTEERENIYQVGENGIAKVESQTAETPPDSTILRLIPEVSKELVSPIVQPNITDHGQSSKEDTDLYTTRS